MLPHSDALAKTTSSPTRNLWPKIIVDDNHAGRRLSRWLRAAYAARVLQSKPRGPAMKSILIANRGEIAIRIAHAVTDMELRAVMLFATDDADSLHVGAAENAVALPGRGPAEIGRAHV